MYLYLISNLRSLLRLREYHALAAFQVTRADYISGRTALHFAAVNGHVRCLRLVVADFVPSAPFEPVNGQSNGGRGDSLNPKSNPELRFVVYVCLYVLLLSDSTWFTIFI